MDSKRIAQFCRLGEEADSLCNRGEYDKAQKKYLHILEDLERENRIDSYLVSKITLGLLLCHVRRAEFDKAFAIWNADMEDSVFGIGIFGLENGQANLRDLIAYDFVCAYLHSVREAHPEEAAAAINQYMSRVCEHAYDEGDRELMRLALSNWKQHLRDVFPSLLPQPHVLDLVRWEKKFGETVALMSLSFPATAEWQKPETFEEMTAVERLLVGEDRSKPNHHAHSGQTVRKARRG